MWSIRYPNRLADLVILGFKGPGTIGFTVRPVAPGDYRLLVWPEGLPEPDFLLHRALSFAKSAGPPAHGTVQLADSRQRPFRRWQWALRRSSPSATPLDDLAGVLLSSDIVTSGRLQIRRETDDTDVRIVAWSCHQPYASRDEYTAVLGENAESILRWYAERVFDFRPHVIWGGGDTGYSDGTAATDFSNQVYNKGAWYSSPINRLWLKEEYRNMYRYFWSLRPMRKVMENFPHLFIWDDHEIHDGWGSEGIDFEPGNLEMFKVAQEVAHEYILNAGPRLRPDSDEAHQGYRMGSMGAFVFDTRSRRNYEAPRERLISDEQFKDFVHFLAEMSRVSELTDLVTCTSVPFVNLRTWVTETVTRVPDFVNEGLLEGVRDDVRDSWTSPGNFDTLKRVLQALVAFMQARPEVRVWNISGDIHVANAFEIWVPGTPRPIYQITTSAITNRTHPPKLIEMLTEIRDGASIEGVGYVRRIWETVTEPNILFCRFGHGRAEVTLGVWNRDSTTADDLTLVV